MTPRRIAIIPGIRGKLTKDGKVSEPDVYWILEKWLERHPEVSNRREDIRISSGRWTAERGLNTEGISATIVAAAATAGYDPE